MVVQRLVMEKKFVEVTQNVSAVGAQQQVAVIKSEAVFDSLLHCAFRGEL